MDLFTFITKIIESLVKFFQSLVWPGVVLLFLYLIRPYIADLIEPLRDLIGRTKQVKVPGGGASFYPSTPLTRPEAPIKLPAEVPVQIPVEVPVPPPRPRRSQRKS